jgi:Signal recognition particle, alpha subunit, N-terminal
VGVQGLDLVFVAAYQHMLSVPFVDALLTSMRDEFAAVYKPDVFDYEYFDDTYKRLLSRAQKNSVQARSKTSKGNNSQVCEWMYPCIP